MEMNLLSLPREVLIDVILYLETEERLLLFQVCKQLNTHMKSKEVR